jgi:dihydrofolate synthase/folylpolyglutamate synthase
MNYQETAHWLCALRSQGSKFGVERMAQLSQALGNPERTFPSIHVAGSNGKGSTCAMLEAVYRAHGWRTGLYTSPHLVRLGERVQVDREPLGEAAICRYSREISAVVDGAAWEADMMPSFFEFMTAMAFLEFRRQQVGLALVEVGLGGRLDATNILQPQLVVMTSISLEHTDYLGDTIEEIAREKGGIIKAGVPVVLGWMDASAENVLREIAQQRGAPLYCVRERFEVARHGFCLFPESNLAGAHQRANAALTQLATEVLQSQFPVEAARRRSALRQVVWAARWQTFALSRGRRLFIDAAHNAEGARAIEPLLAQLVAESGRRPLLVVGVLGVERARPLLETLGRHAQAFWFVRPEQERACGFQELEACVPACFEGLVSRATLGELFPAPGECALGVRGDAVIVVGSVYLAGEVLGRFLPGSAPAESHLQDRLSDARS